MLLQFFHIRIHLYAGFSLMRNRAGATPGFLQYQACPSLGKAFPEDRAAAPILVLAFTGFSARTEPDDADCHDALQFFSNCPGLRCLPRILDQVRGRTRAEVRRGVTTAYAVIPSYLFVRKGKNIGTRHRMVLATSLRCPCYDRAHRRLIDA